MRVRQVHHVEGPTLLVTVGPAASGKSTLLRGLVTDGVVDAVVSTDRLRAELDLAPDEIDRTYATARRRVRDLLDDGLVVAVDATNVRATDRASWLAVAARSRAVPVAVRVGVGLDLEQLLVRDAGRDRHVPARVIRHQLTRAARTTPAVLVAEGFTVVDPRSTELVRGVPVGTASTVR